MKEFFVAVMGPDCSIRETWSLVDAETPEKAALEFARTCSFEMGETRVMVREAGEGSAFSIKTVRAHSLEKIAPF